MSWLEHLFSAGTIERLGWMLVHVLWQATALALLLAVLLRLLRRAKASFRYTCACAALALMVILPLVTLQLIQVPGPVAEAGPPPATVVAPSTDAPASGSEQAGSMEYWNDGIMEERSANSPTFQYSNIPSFHSLPVPLRERIISALEPALPYVVLGWLVGVFGLSAWHLGGWTQLQRLKRRMVREIGAPLHRKLEELALQLGVRRAVGLLESALVEVPTVVGWLRPMILLPASALTGLRPEQLEAILAHELAHIRRYDYLVNMLQTVVEILGFYHPAVWWVSHRIRIERENCCDDLAVQVCGSSLQYARALACMEEIRHNAGDLAVAATGGSLVARIARLLGRPAVEDRRFAWLPGLIALLLVVGIILPAALVFATPDAPPAMPSEQNPVEARADETIAPSPKPRTIPLGLIAMELFSDAVLDSATAERAGTLLALPQEYLQGKPLAAILRTFLHDPKLPYETAAPLADLLATHGYGEILTRRVVLLEEGKEDTISVRSPADPNAFKQTETTKRFDLDLTFTPQIGTDGNFVAVDAQVSLGHPVTMRRDRDWWARANRMSFRVPAIARAGSYTIGALPAEREDEQGRMRTPLLLLKLGDAKLDTNPDTHDETHVQLGANPQSESPSTNDQAAEVLLEFRIAQITDDLRPNRALLQQTAQALGDQSPLARRLREPGREPDITLGEVFKRYVVAQPLSEPAFQAMIRLLQSQSGVKMLSAPRVLTRDGVQAEIRVMTGERFVPASDPAGNPERIEYGTVVNATPHVLDSERVALRLRAEISDLVPGPDVNQPTIARMSAEASVVAANDQYLVWAAIEASATTPGPGTDRPSTYLMVKPHISLPPQGPADAVRSQEPAKARLRQVRLDVRTVTMEHSGLVNLGVEWSWPKIQAGTFSGPSGSPPGSGATSAWPYAVQIGYTPDRTFTDSLLKALDLLQENGQADISGQQILAQEGRRSEIKALTEEWYMATSGATKQSLQSRKAETGTVVTVTPYVGDNNDITLQMVVEVSTSVPKARGSDLPIVTRRMAKNAVTVRDGGTIALAGLTENRTGSDDKSVREIAIFVTAHLVHGPDAPLPPVATVPAKSDVQTQAELDRTPQINELMARTKALWKQQQYEATLDQLESLLAIDPLHDEALTLKPMVQDMIGLRKQMELDGQPLERVPVRTLVPMDPASIPVYEQFDREVDLSELTCTTPLSTAINMLRESVEPPLNIVVLWRDLRDTLNIEPTKPIGMEGLSKVKLGKALETLVKAISGPANTANPVDFIINKGTIIIGTRAGLPQYPKGQTESSAERGGATITDTFANGATISPEQRMMLRQEYVNSDPLVRGVAKRIVKTEQELIVLQQTLAPDDQTVVVKNVILKALREALDRKRKELEQQYDAGLAQRLRTSGQTPADATTGMITPEQVMSFRREYVNLDSVVQELSKNIAETQRELELILAPQTLPSDHPTVIQKKELLMILHRKLQERYKELEEQFDRGLAERLGKATNHDHSGTADVNAPEERGASQAWHVMRQWNCPPLLLGLTPQLAQVLEAARRNDPVWQEVSKGGALRLKLDVEGDLPGEVIVGLFKDAQWSAPPVAVRRLGAGTHVLTGLPAGRYQIGAMLGNAPVPLALGVHRTWPEPVEITAGQTATAEVLVCEAFQKWASGWYNQEVAKDYLGQWDDLHEDNLLQGQLTGPDGKPIPFGLVEIREHHPGAHSIATADQGTNEQGVFKFDGMNWPYTITAVWREGLPSVLGQRRQRMYLSRVLEGARREDFRFAPFPEGTAKVAGRVVDQNGEPVQGFFLRVHMPPFSDLDLSRVTDGYKTQVTYDVPIISEDGRFELGNLPAGRATVDIVPFEVPRYQRERGKDVVLEAGQTTQAEVKLVGKGVFYGHVLFEDGTPAVIRPAPWRGAVTRIMMTFGPRAAGVGEVGPDGYFTLYLGDSDKEALSQGNNRLLINMPTDQGNRWDKVGEFPYEKLAEDKSKAGVVTVKRPGPTPTLPAELRRGGPLPSGWRLEYYEETRPDRRRMTQVLLEARLTGSDEEQFELYGPDGKKVRTLGPRSTSIIDKAERYTLIGVLKGERGPDDWPVTHGPFALDLSRPGRYTLHMDVSAPAQQDQPSLNPTSRSSNEPTATETFANADLLEVLTQISKRTATQIIPDATVKATPITAELGKASPEGALQEVLKNTPYTFRKAKDGSYLVFRPLSFTFPQVELVQALQDLSAATGVTIIPDSNVTGTVDASLKDVSLDEALQILLAGKPYVFKPVPEKNARYYLVASRSVGGTKTPQTVTRPQRVRLDARVVVIEHGDLQNLGIEWDCPTSPPRPAGTKAPIGYVPDHASTHALMMALNLLQEDGKADIIANPKLVALDGRQAEMRVIEEEWFLMTTPDPNSLVNSAQLSKIESGTALAITPTIGDNDDITLQIAVEVSDRIPKSKAPDGYIITRRTVRGSVTIRGGGTVAISGVTPNRNRSGGKRVPGLSDLPLIGKLFQDNGNDKANREIVVFVTAQLVNQTNETGGSTPPSVRSATPVSSAGATLVSALGTVESVPASTVPAELRSVGSPEETQRARQLEREANSDPFFRQVKTSMVEYAGASPATRQLMDRSFDVRRSLDLVQQKLPSTHFEVVQRKALLQTLEEAIAQKPSQLDPALWERVRPRRVIFTTRLFSSRAEARLDAGTARQVSSLAAQAGTSAQESLSRDALRATPIPQILSRLSEHLQAEQFNVLVKLLESKGLVNLRTAYGTYKEEDQTASMAGTAINILSAILDSERSMLLDIQVEMKPPTSPRSLAWAGTRRIPIGRVLSLDLETPGDRRPDEGYCLLIEPTIIAGPKVSLKVADTPGPGITATFANADVRLVLMRIAERTGVRIALDATVKATPITAELVEASAETALRQVLKGTPYTSRMMEDGTRLVFRPLSKRFANTELVTAIQDVAATAGVPIIVDPNVMGAVNVAFENVTLHEAMEMLLAGRPYLFKKTADYYLVASRLRKQVVLDACFSIIEPNDLRGLPVVWDWFKLLTTSAVTKAPIGYARERTATNTLLAALDQLRENGRARIVTNVKRTVEGGQRTEIKFAQEQSAVAARSQNFEDRDARRSLQRMVSDMVMAFTASWDDHDEITLAIGVETSDSISGVQRDSRFPSTSRQIVTNEVVIKNGGTVVISGLPGYSAGPKAEPAREMTAFVTARLVAEDTPNR